MLYNRIITPTWVQCPAAVVCLELCHVCVALVAAVGLAAGHLKLAEPGEHDVLDVLNAGVALGNLLIHIVMTVQKSKQGINKMCSMYSMQGLPSVACKACCDGAARQNFLNQGNTMCSMHSMLEMPCAPCW
jgi:hypothetical protein